MERIHFLAPDDCTQTGYELVQLHLEQDYGSTPPILDRHAHSHEVPEENFRQAGTEETPEVVGHLT